MSEKLPSFNEQLKADLPESVSTEGINRSQGQELLPKIPVETLSIQIGQTQFEAPSVITENSLREKKSIDSIEAQVLQKTHLKDALLGNKKKAITALAIAVGAGVVTVYIGHHGLSHDRISDSHDKNLLKPIKKALKNRAKKRGKG